MPAIAILTTVGLVAIAAFVLKGNLPMTTTATATEQPLSADTGEANMRAMLATVRWAEGTAQAQDPYKVTYGYGAPLEDLFVNPWDSGQMQSVSGPSGSTSACGAYQFEPETWADACRALGQSDQTFDPAAQDAAAYWLIDVKRGAGQLVRGGQLRSALDKLSWEWASLPPSRYGQPQRTYEQVAAVFQQNGGVIVG